MYLVDLARTLRRGRTGFVALVMAALPIVIVAAVAFLGKAASNKFSTIGSGVQNA